MRSQQILSACTFAAPAARTASEISGTVLAASRKARLFQNFFFCSEGLLLLCFDEVLTVIS
jgi:hypothetical protein